jgi:hypothetical protein
MIGSISSGLQGITRAMSKALASGANRSRPAAAADKLTRAVILNCSEDTLNRELLELLLQTIFESNEEYMHFVRERLTRDILSGSIAEAELEIEKIVLAAVQERASNANAMAALLFAHKARTAENARAYSAQGRSKPEALFWPNPADANRPRSLREELPFVNRHPLVTRKTAIASAGSCFAAEIAHWLQEQGFNYVVKEPSVAPDGTYCYRGYESRPYAAGSAAWGIHFNTPSFLQLVEKAFGYRRPAKILWTSKSLAGKDVYCDPFREEIEFPSIDAFEQNYDKHIAAARAVFMEAEVFIVTLGLNEVWYFKPDGSVFSRSPWRTAPNLVEHRVLTVQENVDALQRMYDILLEHNPRLKLIVSLSPVPLHATFLGDHKHIIEANTHSKSVLRVAAEEFCNANRDAYYFPSFEMVTTCLKDPWQKDERHVSADAVARVMHMFQEMYCY